MDQDKREFGIEIKFSDSEISISALLIKQSELLHESFSAPLIKTKN